MKKNRVLNIFSLIFNIAIVGFVIYAALIMSVLDPYVYESGFTTAGFNFLVFFTAIANVLLGIAALINIPFNIISIAKGTKLNKAAVVLKIIGTTCTTLTMIIALGYLGFVVEGGFTYITSGANLYAHIITPILALVSLIFFDKGGKIKFRYNFLSIIPVFGYSIYYIISNPEAFNAQEINTDHDIYQLFFWYSTEMPLYLVIIYMIVTVIVFLVATFLISLALWGLNKIYNKEVEAVESATEAVAESASASTASEEESKEEEKVEEPKEEATAEEKPATESKSKKSSSKTSGESSSDSEKTEEKEAKATEEKPNNLYNGKTRTYHITKQQSTGMWQVKLAGGQRAIKVFRTQKEAIEYAKGLVATQGGSIRVHSVNGQIRKH